MPELRLDSGLAREELANLAGDLKVTHTPTKFQFINKNVFTNFERAFQDLSFMEIPVSKYTRDCRDLMNRCYII